MRSCLMQELISLSKSAGMQQRVGRYASAIAVRQQGGERAWGAHAAAAGTCACGLDERCCGPMAAVPWLRRERHTTYRKGAVRTRLLFAGTSGELCGWIDFRGGAHVTLNDRPPVGFVCSESIERWMRFTCRQAEVRSDVTGRGFSTAD